MRYEEELTGNISLEQQGKIIRVCFSFVSFCFGNKKLLTQREKGSPKLLLSRS